MYACTLMTVKGARAALRALKMSRALNLTVHGGEDVVVLCTKETSKIEVVGDYV